MSRLTVRCPELNVFYNNLKKDWCKPQFKTKEESKVIYKKPRFVKNILTGFDLEECINDGQGDCLLYE